MRGKSGREGGSTKGFWRADEQTGVVSSAVEEQQDDCKSWYHCNLESPHLAKTASHLAIIKLSSFEATGRQWENFQVESFSVIWLYETVEGKWEDVDKFQINKIEQAYRTFPNLFIGCWCWEWDILRVVLGNHTADFYVGTLWVIFGEFLDSVYKVTRLGDLRGGPRILPPSGGLLSFMETLGRWHQTAVPMHLPPNEWESTL